MQAVVHDKAGRAGVMEVIARRFVLYPQPERSKAAWNAWWADYYAALEDLPMVSLEAAMNVWVRGPQAEFLPKPGQLLGLTATTQVRELILFDRARAALKRFDQSQVEKGRPAPVDAEIAEELLRASRAAVRQMAEAYGAQVDANRIVPPPLPPVTGPVDAFGVSLEMRKVLIRRAYDDASPNHS